jgi:flagellar biosynthesis protein FlhG
MDDHPSSRSDRPPGPGAPPRARGLRRLTVLGTGRWHAPLGKPATPRVLAVCGPPGVGKSTVAANLAIALAGLRSRVVLVDLDLRHPTQHRIFGLTSPIAGLQALLEDDVDTMEQALTPTAVRNLFLVTADGLRPPEPPSPQKQLNLLRQIWDLDADVIIADVGSSEDAPALDLQALGAHRIVVSPSEVRAIGGVYAYLREQVAREIERAVGDDVDATPLMASALASLNSRAAPSMRDLLDGLRTRPAIQAEVTRALVPLGSWLIGNRARSPDEADLMHAASRLFADYLGLVTPVLGIVAASEHLAATSGSGRPLLLGAGIDRNVRVFHAMAEQLLVEPAVAATGAIVASASATPSWNGAAVRPGEPGDARSPLPVPLGTYMRRFPRHAVDWHARYVSQRGRDVDVRVFEVSEGGASIEAIPGFDLGPGGRLTFTQIEGQPTLNVTVMDARRPMGRAGVRFDDGAEITARLAAIAAAAGHEIATAPAEVEAAPSLPAARR